MKYFSLNELECPCCKEVVFISDLGDVLDDVREHFGRPCIVTSGYRCPTHNKEVGGAEKSKHLEGLAADIQIKGLTPNAVYNYLDTKYPDKYGIGQYNNWVHVDVRKEKARW
jgi:uncharacterized protein YcbK (DUF882 family)